MVTRKLTRAQQAAQDAKIKEAVNAALLEYLNSTSSGEGSKPHLVGDLRATWRKSGTHVREQVIRFLRLTFIAAQPTLLPFLFAGKFDKTTLLAFLVPVLEVAYRQFFPALGAKAADDTPGVTIVPDQVGVSYDAPMSESDVEGDAAP